MLLYVLCTAGEFVWNEGGVVPATCYLLPAPYITMCDFLYRNVFYMREVDVLLRYPERCHKDFYKLDYCIDCIILRFISLSWGAI